MSLDNLKLVTNYAEKDLSNQNSVNLFYVEFLHNDDEEYLRELKAKRREVAIDVVLGEKEDSNLEELKIHKICNSVGGYNISNSVYNVNSKVQFFSDYNQMYEDLLSFLDKETNSLKNIPTVSNINLVFKKDINLTDNENHKSFCRKIITRLTMCSNIIAMDGRIGIGNFVLVGKDNWDYFRYIEENIKPFSGSNPVLSIIYTDKIQTNKVIVGRTNNSDQSGISLFVDLENQKYTRFETNLWKKQYCWFNIL